MILKEELETLQLASLMFHGYICINNQCYSIYGTIVLFVGMILFIEH